ncbi:MAG: hypothetical protein A2W91_08145 [Bacteroidetes bacterium GWF2_38_335]|nr:MAG: hypothetical protein A2W91_08145 [Bacteroidetes bacterium GWF2_38_335]OFY78985.1 MAG: hypothetical protein A2281_02575 [Bacteroidetes bacterium RIFOXYA12_FULL_38_20]HBS86056.1 TonB-dependent receptor [Bacteroidales bacterium]
MKKNQLFLLFIALIFPFGLFSQEYLKGVVSEVVEKDGKKELNPLENVNIYWENSSVGTTTNEKGEYSILIPETVSRNLIFSYIGYKADTIPVHVLKRKLDIVLEVNNVLQEVIVAERRKSMYISKIEPIHTQLIQGEELKKAACCNLSESFETNASVDVSYSDAITGAKQIKMLGLAGTYSQIMAEKVPFIRGLAQTYGLGYIPGSWMESIQVSKGTASVSSGYESITGQINVEYKKPDKGEKLYLNALGSSFGKIEGNMNARYKLNDKLSTMILAHGESERARIDENGDSFMDMPAIDQVNFINRWTYDSKNWETRFGIKVLEEKRSSGQVDFEGSDNTSPANGYGVGIDSKYYELFHKMGFFLNRKNTSISIIHALTLFDQNSFFGLNDYAGSQMTYNTNIMFASYVGNTNHSYLAGISYLYDDYDEEYSNAGFYRTEKVPGTFIEYTYAIPHKYTLMAGLRYDQHNMFGGFFTPRAHIKYNLTPLTVVRASAGKGYRTPNLLSENSHVFVSSREMVILEDIEMEEAWNYGISATHTLNVGKKEIDINAEFYRTNFINQLIVDMDQNTTTVYFYNLDGESYSNSAQLELVLEPIKRLDVTLAYRLTDVKTTINHQLVNKPLVNKYKGLVSLSYTTNLKKWQFDFTTQFNGDGRLPSTANNPVEYQLNDNFPAYYIMNAQVTKYFRKWNIYFGSENLTNFTQKNPILAANDPFGPNFDASMNWGPLIGRKFYLGLRLVLN